MYVFLFIVPALSEIENSKHGVVDHRWPTRHTLPKTYRLVIGQCGVTVSKKDGRYERNESDETIHQYLIFVQPCPVSCGLVAQR